METKLGVVTLEQLGQLPTYPNRPRRTPEPTQREENPLQVPPTNRTAIYVRNLPADQDPEQKLQDDLRRCREYCKEQALEVVIEYSDPKGSWTGVKGVDKTYQWGVEGQRKCPLNCPAKMSLA